MRSKIARCAGSPPGHGKRGPLAKWQVERRRLVKSAPEIIGTALAFHYINRTVDVFLEKSPMELPSTLAWAKGPLTKVAASTFAKRLVHVSARPGVSLRLLPEAPLPSDFAWAESNPFLAGAYARLAAVLDWSVVHSRSRPCPCARSGRALGR